MVDWNGRRRVLVPLLLIPLVPIGFVALAVTDETGRLARTSLLSGLLGAYFGLIGSIAWAVSGLILLVLVLWKERPWIAQVAGWGRAIRAIFWRLVALHLATARWWDKGAGSRRWLAALVYCVLAVVAVRTLEAVRALMLIVLGAQFGGSDGTEPGKLAVVLYMALAVVMAVLAAVLYFEGKLCWAKGGGWRLLAVLAYCALVPIGSATLPMLLPIVCFAQL